MHERLLRPDSRRSDGRARHSDAATGRQACLASSWPALARRNDDSHGLV